ELSLVYRQNFKSCYLCRLFITLLFHCSTRLEHGLCFRLIKYFHLNPDLDVVLTSELGLEYDSVAYLVPYCFKAAGHVIVDEVDLVLAHFLRKESIR
uniref:Uncharacterized protein n=1 Tax=Neovison vison TaxID=452646 RepID=A0A8C7AWI4_NEOVI